MDNCVVRVDEMEIKEVEIERKGTGKFVLRIPVNSPFAKSENMCFQMFFCIVSVNHLKT